MRYQCPSCKQTGTVRVPESFPKDKKARIRCPACNHSFSLAPGRLWPQDSEEAYRALAVDARPGGLQLAGLRVEIHGRARETHPLLVLPPHPAVQTVLLPDLLGFLTEYTRVCYLGFPESAAGIKPDSRATGAKADLERLEALLDLLKVRLHSERFHLLAPAASADLALRLAAARPGTVASLILLEPELDCRPGRPGRRVRRLLSRNPQQMTREQKEELLFALFTEGHASKLPHEQLRGLAVLQAPGFSPARLGETRRRRLRAPFLGRLRIPVLLVLSRDGSRRCRENGLFLQAALPAAETLELDRGGAWAAWLSAASFPNRVLAFLRSLGRSAAPARAPRRGASGAAARPAGQSLGWMLLLFAALTLGLGCLPAFFAFQPAYMGAVLPLVLGSLLPLLWYLLPKRMGIFRFLRFRGFRPAVLLPALLAGLLLGLAWDALNVAVELSAPPGLTVAFSRLSLPAWLPSSWAARLTDLSGSLTWPEWLVWQLPGEAGRGPLLAALLALCVPVFGYFQSLLTLRRSRWQLALPVLLFLFLIPAWPDLLWRLPFAVGAALLFARSLSLASPFIMLAGFYLASELPRLLLRDSWTAALLARVELPALPLDPVIGVAALLLLLFLAAVLVWGRKKQGYSPEALYFHRTRLVEPQAALHWRIVPGLVLILFSLLGALVLVFGFLQV